MQPRNQISAAPCDFAERFQFAAEALFSQMTAHTSPEQFTQCQESLRQLKEELEAERKARGRFHFASQAGSLHHCVAQAYQVAQVRLRFVAQLHQQALPPQRLIRREGIIVDLAENLETSTEETDVGTDDSPFAEGNGR
jgi:hypothetical protein